MQLPEYDADGNIINRPTVVTPVTTPVVVEDKGSKTTIGIIAAIVVAAVIAFFVFRGNSPVVADAGNKVSETTSAVYDSTKDVAKEVPQAAKDAVTKGDQDTTRPNKDDSTKNLDQK